jgi:uncharacterized protein (DUF1499 family)
MKTMLKILLLIVVLAPLALLLAGQLGLLAGTAPEGLGLTEGKLKAPRSTPNSVSSQASLHPTHPRHQEAQIEPLAFKGDGQAAMMRLAELVAAMPGTKLIKQDGGYLYFECQSRWLKFADDLEFALDEKAQVIHVRSASRLGRRDFNVNRERVEAIRARFAA